MIPGTYDLAIYRGDTSKWQFKLWADAEKTEPIDLTGVTVTAMIRDKAVGGTVVQSATCTTTAPNIVNMTITAAESRTLPLKGVWDLQLTYTGGEIKTALKGAVTVTPDVTYTGSLAARRPVTMRRE